MSAFTLAKNNLSIRTVSFVGLILGLVAILDIVMCFKGYQGFLYSSISSLFSTFLFAIVMTMFAINRMASGSNFNIEEKGKTINYLFIIYHIVISLIILGMFFLHYVASYWDAVGYLLLPVVLIIVSVISTASRK